MKTNAEIHLKSSLDALQASVFSNLEKFVAKYLVFIPTL